MVGVVKESSTRTDVSSGSCGRQRVMVQTW